MTFTSRSTARTKEDANLDRNFDAEEDDVEYNESEDEDYDPTKDNSEDNNSQSHDINQRVKGSSEQEDITEDDRKEMKKYKMIESSNGGLVKTRHQREQEIERSKNEKWQHSMNKSKKGGSLDIDSIWAELQGKSHEVLARKRSPSLDSTVETNVSSNIKTQRVSAPSPAKEPPRKIKIKRTYEFAGKVVTEEKWVDSSSQEARAHLNSLKLEGVSKNSADKPKSAPKRKLNSQRQHPNLRRKRRRPGLLEAVINGSSAAKISTLEKSRLDWAKYVDKEKIHEELKYKNKAGYLDNQDFLNRVNTRQDTLYRDAKTDARKKQ
ncbi:hypothetical protein HII12_003526 [Brettanomyces bruxellensis]|uniref:SWR1-complex protein 5 n=1 Tax=Dekkera bruxellensis TaxID=5007 RepID=A0A8H6BDT6_DEKBR|nr:hypothetical protein HII12_003526 [Brettanomyces bruxellensis]